MHDMSSGRGGKRQIMPTPDDCWATDGNTLTDVGCTATCRPICCMIVRHEMQRYIDEHYNWHGVSVKLTQYNILPQMAFSRDMQAASSGSMAFQHI